MASEYMTSMAATPEASEPKELSRPEKLMMGLAAASIAVAAVSLGANVVDGVRALVHAV
ncbi:MAG TPA: hypothetical protein VGF75_06565 [Candidatus Saccharimonadales bacterium]|jgi:hypothetical protein